MPVQQQQFGARPKPPHHHSWRTIRIPTGPAVTIILIALIVGGTYYLLTSGGSSVAISGSQNINVGPSGTVVTIGGSEYLIALAQSYPDVGQAFVYVSKLPIFVNPFYNVSVSSTTNTKLSASTSNGYANMQLQAVQITNSTDIAIRVTPLDPSLSISPDYSKIREIQSYFGNGTVGQSLISIPGSNSTTTTVPPVISSGSSTTTAASTTTVAATNNTNANIMATFKASSYYPVLTNLTTMYSNTAQCTESDYNSAYISQYSHSPQPPLDYPNQSTVIPYSLSYNITNEGNGIYGIVYSTKTTSPYGAGAGQAMTININPQTGKVVNATFTKYGAFAGSTGVGSLQAIYNRATKIGGACGIEVP